jgi:DNA-directed RNA polymerase subunit RPC12/RpoP
MADEVELIPSGYAWRCPECNHTEYENSVPAAGRVRCSRCGASFAVTKVSHRVEPGLLDGEHPVFEAQGVGAQRSTDRPVPEAPHFIMAPSREA